MHIIRHLQILHTHDYNLLTIIKRVQRYKYFLILTNKITKL